MWRKFLLYFHTLRYLRWQQIYYRLWYALQKRLFGARLPKISCPEVKLLQFQPSLDAPATFFQPPFTFSFLNRTHTFDKKIDWNFRSFGKLWTYNLTYFEFLNQTALRREQGLYLISDFIAQAPHIKDGLEPFPTSLRIIFWIRFLQKHQLQEPDIDQSLYRQVKYLEKHPEYHLLGNHLLENGFALLFGAVYFIDNRVFRLAKRILQTQLNEQILPDGGHFERSPMYHQHLLYRLLDSINLLQHNLISDSPFLPFLQAKAAQMLGWLQKMTFRNGDIPLFNDSALGIAPTSKELFEYAARLGVAAAEAPLSISGYRRFDGEHYELIADVGDIGPDYIPGHAHCDTLSFVLYVHAQPFLVDTGTSTYEANAVRQAQRATAAHNTVQINDAEQSEVWGAFRVARRAHATILEETPQSVRATHHGFHRVGGQHTRTFTCEPHIITIEDRVIGQPAKAFFHFHPVIDVQLHENELQTSLGVISFTGATKIELSAYQFASEFNKTIPGTKVTVWFGESLKTQVRPSLSAIRKKNEPRTVDSQWRTAKSE